MAATTATRPAFTDKDRADLRLFCKLCGDIARCRFMVKLPTIPHHIFIGRLPNGQTVDEYPRYDEDDLRSFLGTHYRKLRMNDEDTCLFKIMKLLVRKGHPDDVATVKHF